MNLKDFIKDSRPLVNDGFDFSASDGENFIAMSRQGVTRIEDDFATFETKNDIYDVELLSGEADFLREKHGF